MLWQVRVEYRVRCESGEVFHINRIHRHRTSNACMRIMQVLEARASPVSNQCAECISGAGFYCKAAV